jgi:catechol 2,3-dioxygenase-like lactoylglutathione lyase family enzyme
VGGRYRFVSRGPGGAEMAQGGMYREIVPDERLVYTELFDDQSYAGESLITAVLTERDGRTTLTTTVRLASPQARATMLRYPMARGVAEGYDRLDAVLVSERKIMNWTVEVVIVPVSDVDRAKEFYAEKVGFTVDHDSDFGVGRIVQLTPPGSGCSIVIGHGVVPDMPPGSLKGLQLVVPDIHRARKELLDRGVDVGEVTVMGENPHPVADPLDNVGFVHFTDPDGNAWAVQQISSRG